MQWNAEGKAVASAGRRGGVAGDLWRKSLFELREEMCDTHRLHKQTSSQPCPVLPRPLSPLARESVQGGRPDELEKRANLDTKPRIIQMCNRLNSFAITSPVLFRESI